MARKQLKAILLGVTLAIIIFLMLNGFDLMPLLFVAGGLAALRYLLVDGRGLGGARFQSLGEQEEDQTPSISFDDIGGQEVAKREFLEALDFIKNSSQMQRLGIRPLKGILLAGPPGTGKTLLAKAAAAYTNAVFLAASGSEFVEVYAGVGAQRIRKLFARARQQARAEKKENAVIFLDELEVLGGKRGQHTSHLEYDQTLNELLVQMDGISASGEVRILVVGATNRPDLLDAALLRPGRFDRIVQVELPSKEGRLEILKIHTRNKPLAADVNLEVLARETFGFSGAQLESMANEAAITALRASRQELTLSDFREAMDKVMLGEKQERVPSREELWRVAVHETGHALISELLHPGAVAVVTITPRGRAMGYTRQTPREETYLHTLGSLTEQIDICLGGALAEELVLGSRSTGAGNDFQQAVKLARQIIESGLSELGIVSEDLPAPRRHETLQRILRREEESVRRFLAERRSLLEEIARRLLAEEKLSGEEVRALLQTAA